MQGSVFSYNYFALPRVCVSLMDNSIRKIYFNKNSYANSLEWQILIKSI